MCKCSINPVINLNPVYSHSTELWQYKRLSLVQSNVIWQKLSVFILRIHGKLQERTVSGLAFFVSWSTFYVRPGFHSPKGSCRWLPVAKYPAGGFQVEYALRLQCILPTRKFKLKSPAGHSFQSAETNCHPLNGPLTCCLQNDISVHHKYLQSSVADPSFYT
jgi:hypothetical protein